MRTADQSKARTWKITNPEKLNPITGKPVGYKLVPFTRGAAMPTLLTVGRVSLASPLLPPSPSLPLYENHPAT